MIEMLGVGPGGAYESLVPLHPYSGGSLDGGVHMGMGTNPNAACVLSPHECSLSPACGFRRTYPNRGAEKSRRGLLRCLAC